MDNAWGHLPKMWEDLEKKLVSDLARARKAFIDCCTDVVFYDWCQKNAPDVFPIRDRGARVAMAASNFRELMNHFGGLATLRWDLRGEEIPETPTRMDFEADIQSALVGRIHKLEHVFDDRPLGGGCRICGRGAPDGPCRKHEKMRI